MAEQFCQPQLDWPASVRCAYVDVTDACSGGGYLDWTAFVFCCDSDVGKWFIVAAGVLFMLVVCLMLSTAADDFFCPNISTIVNNLNISENLAGVTFMAFGNGANDVFTSLASVVSAPQPRADLALGSVIGGAIFISLVALSAVVLTRPFKAAMFSVLRDLFFFAITMGFLLLFFLYADEVQLWQPLCCLGVYIAYVVTVIIMEYIKKRRRMKVAPEIDICETCTTEETLSVHTAEGTRTPDRKHTHRLSIVSRRSVIVPSMGGGAGHKFIIEDTIDKDLNDEFIIATEEHHIKKKSINQHIVHGVRGVLLDLKSYFAPEFEDEKPSKFTLIRTYALLPIVWLFKLTIPLSTANWSKPMAVVLSVIAPQCFLFNIKMITTVPVAGGPGLYAYAPIVSIPLIIFVVVMTKMDQEPRYYKMFYALAGFIMSASWMYCISSEVVDAVTMIGVVTGIDQAVLGLTVIAWANCVGDLVADSSVARQGFPRMGMAAATGGPLFNVLIGFGLPFSIAKIRGVPVPISFDSSTLIMITFMFVSLIITAIAIIALRGRLNRIYGIILITTYVSFLVFVVLSATGILLWIKE